MPRVTVLCLALSGLPGCKPEPTLLPDPMPLTEASVGHFCQMNLMEHDGPKAQVHLQDVLAPLFFSQVRDAVAYQRMPEQSHEILGIYVNDMGADGVSRAEPGTTNWIRAEDAVYVTGSRRVGGMGAPELVPFSDHGKAEAFAGQNGGTVVTLAEISDAEVLAAVSDTSQDAAPADHQDDYAARLRALGETTGAKP
ncbi:nitrous oxide reductase accessory protein NosL [uncultured Paracoccus sp.]|uniref:nitrous oxide reductase accessory protein NosL n=1 Tax=uncultured Paracoccus sp. TaxID=189685 RepID=UPI002626B6F6|nr:nitrous oxide reductase accessory protein NosL [uncultured Paracoccus sp.]